MIQNQFILLGTVVMITLLFKLAKKSTVDIYRPIFIFLGKYYLYLEVNYDLNIKECFFSDRQLLTYQYLGIPILINPRLLGFY